MTVKIQPVRMTKLRRDSLFFILEDVVALTLKLNLKEKRPVKGGKRLF